MSPFLAAFLGGIVGGLSCGLVILAVLAIFGRRWAESFFEDQVAWLERRFQERVLDGLLGHVTTFLDKSERIGQIAKRVVEVVQLLFKRPVREELPKEGDVLGAEGLSKVHAGLGLALVKLGRDDDARTEFESALRLDPDDATALKGLRELDRRAAEGDADEGAEESKSGKAKRPRKVSTPPPPKAEEPGTPELPFAPEAKEELGTGPGPESRSGAASHSPSPSLPPSPSPSPSPSLPPSPTTTPPGRRRR